MKTLHRLNRGFTLIEVVIVVGCIALLSAMVVPKVIGLFSTGTTTMAITRAEALNGAMFTYNQKIPSAAVNWAAAPDNPSMYLLLYNAAYLPNEATTLAGFEPSGFTYSFPAALTGRVTITGPSGVVSY
jgi:prepilin-type N-terminal cleavage/methylation domain-containing protein